MKILVLLFLWIPVISLGQDIYFDFEENDLTGWFPSKEGNWCISGDEPLEGSYSLKHCYDSDSAGWDQISFFHDPLWLNNAETCWQFEIRHTFPPSSKNHWAIILSDREMPVQGHILGDGLAIGVNLSGNSDELKVWRLLDGAIFELLNTEFNWQEHQLEHVPVGFDFHKSVSGEYQLKMYTSGQEWTFSQEIFPKEITSINVFTLYYAYTASYDQGIWLDKVCISGKTTQDLLPPELEAVYVLSPQTLEIQFNEIVDVPDDLTVCVPGVGCSMMKKGISDNYRLELPEGLSPGETYLLELPLLKDLYGNTVQGTYRVEDFYYPKSYDLIITEIMADPSPPILLPEAEYLELKNVSGRDLHLKNSSLKVNNRICKLPVLNLPPDAQILLTGADQIDQFLGTDLKKGIPDFPSIANKGAWVVLSDAAGSLLHAVQYSDDWHTDINKREGGWSLEMMRVKDPCTGEGNWASSEDYQGGTPGRPNSVNKEGFGKEPVLWRAAISGPSGLALYFSEPLDSMSLMDTRYYSVDRGIGNPDEIIPTWPLANKLSLHFRTNFLPGLEYQIRLTADICDCSADPLASPAIRSFRIPGQADSADILINEIMYAPESGRVEFVELYNASDHTVDLKGFRLSVNETDDTTGIISYEYWPLDSGEYAVISSSLSGIDGPEEFESPERIIFMPDMPVLPNTGARLYLLNEKNTISDLAVYAPEFHHSLLIDTRGVSLERRSSKRTGTSPDNWISASSDAGYMTPAACNSQAEANINKCRVWLDTDRITLNGNGARERLSIQYELEREGFMGQVYIYDIRGLRRKVLAEGLLLGTRGEFVFDGREETGLLLETGYYIVFFRAYHEMGLQYVKKLSFVLAK